MKALAATALAACLVPGNAAEVRVNSASPDKHVDMVQCVDIDANDVDENSDDTGRGVLNGDGNDAANTRHTGLTATNTGRHVEGDDAK